MIKKLIKAAINKSGYTLERKSKHFSGLQSQRPVGDVRMFLEDLKKRGLRCNWIMDVGANNTDWSRMAAAVFSESRFYLVEPQIEMEHLLKNFCLENAGSKYILAGAGAVNESRIFTVWDDLSGSSFLPASTGAGNQISIKVKTINCIIEESGITIPGLIKLDIQGFELEALKGASSTFGTTEVYILETSLFPFFSNMPVFFDVVNFMLERDYVVYDFPGFLRRPFDGALGQCDICFVKRNGFLRKSNNWS